MDPLYAGENYAVEPNEAKALELYRPVLHRMLESMVWDLERRFFSSAENEYGLIRFCVADVVGTMFLEP